MGEVAVAERAVDVKTPLAWEVVKKEKGKVTRVCSIGEKKLFVSLPQAALDDNKTPYAHHDGILPQVFPKKGEAPGTYDFEFKFHPGRRDAEFALSPGARVYVNLLNLEGKVASTVSIESEGTEAKFSAEGNRNRWLTVSDANKVTARGFEAGTDDDIRIVIPQDGFVHKLYLQGNAAGETPDPQKTIGEIFPSGTLNWLNNTKLIPGETKKAFLARLPMVTMEDTRRVVPPDELHPKTRKAREEKEKRAETERKEREKLKTAGDKVDVSRLKALDKVEQQGRNRFLEAIVAQLAKLQKIGRVERLLARLDGRKYYTDQFNTSPAVEADAPASETKQDEKLSILEPVTVQRDMWGEIRSRFKQAIGLKELDEFPAHLGTALKIADMLIWVATHEDKTRAKGTINMLSAEAFRLLAAKEQPYPLRSMYNEVKYSQNTLTDIMHDPLKRASLKVMLAEMDRLLNE
jgi:hypothetical protein